MKWTAALPADFVTAPDGSEIRLLLETARGGLSHCTLAQGKVSLAVKHQTIGEIRFFLGGVGEVWRKLDDREEGVRVGPGVSISLPAGVHFQFRNTGRNPLIFAIATMPPWPGMDEAVPLDGHWPVS